ncbi:hypothetical protein [Oscillibacter ruminantium]|jgi:hypothetical protein
MEYLLPLAKTFKKFEANVNFSPPCFKEIMWQPAGQTFKPHQKSQPPSKR